MKQCVTNRIDIFSPKFHQICQKIAKFLPFFEPKIPQKCLAFPCLLNWFVKVCITRKGLEMFGDLEFEKVPKFWGFWSSKKCRNVVIFEQIGLNFGSKRSFLFVPQCSSVKLQLMVLCPF